jgi:superfamily II DNA or RNA helicase
MICAHSIAVGLQWIAPPPAAAVIAPELKPSVAATPGGPVFGPEADGPLVSLAMILPRTLDPRAATFSVMVEATIGGKSMLLHAVPAAGNYRCREEDARLVRGLREISGQPMPGTLTLPSERFVTLLRSATGHPRVSLGRGRQLHILEVPRERLRLSIARCGEGIRASLSRPEGALLTNRTDFWRWDGIEILEPVALGLPAAHAELFERDVTIREAGVELFVTNELPVLAAHFDVEREKGVEPEAVEAGELTLELEGSTQFLAATIECKDRRGVRKLHPSDRRLPPAAGEIVAQLRAAGFGESPAAKEGLALRGERDVLAFFAGPYQRLQQSCRVKLGSRCANVMRDVEFVRPKFEVQGSGTDWFDLQVELVSDSGQRFSRAELARILSSGRKNVRLRNGKTAIFDSGTLDELDELLRDVDPRQVQPGHYRIGQQHAAEVATAVRTWGGQLDAPRAWTELSNALTSGDPPCPDLGDLADVLRPYQRHGVGWLHLLARLGFGGILADEMGLGKTLQTLAFLRAAGCPALIVCPSSLVFNWREETRRWARTLGCVTIEGANRKGDLAKVGEADVTITSYALLRRDIEAYRRVEFGTVVLDEAQHIKNPEAQNTKAAGELRARHRFVLTGTPVENSARDLWSLMNFVMPGYLGTASDFSERYAKPLAAPNADPAIAFRLARRVRPFVLRRTKLEVTPELPPKIEQASYCELLPRQREFYERLRASARDKVQDMQSGPTRLAMLTLLLRLRQACCDLRLLDPETEEAVASAKLDLLDELISEAIDGGHRLLVFSQFTGMLDLIEPRLAQAEVPFCRLDGSTRDRAAVVTKFKSDAGIPVFLISLKAGGAGLNLAEADTVIHFDPWWNPSVEAQATARAHRIGQERPVTSYKLIARGTVEEKIVELQEKKRAISAGLIESEEAFTAALSAEEIRSLFD